MDYYITYHIDIETLHQDRLIELLNSCRLDILTKYKQLTDIYYSIEGGVLFQHCTTVEKTPYEMFHMKHLLKELQRYTINVFPDDKILDNCQVYGDIYILPENHYNNLTKTI